MVKSMSVKDLRHKLVFHLYVQWPSSQGNQSCLSSILSWGLSGKSWPGWEGDRGSWGLVGVTQSIGILSRVWQYEILRVLRGVRVARLHEGLNFYHCVWVGRVWGVWVVFSESIGKIGVSVSDKRHWAVFYTRSCLWKHVTKLVIAMGNGTNTITIFFTQPRLNNTWNYES